MMKKTFAVVLLAWGLIACHGKKPATTPDKAPASAVEHKDDATGGAAYGGHKTDAEPGKQTANPCAPK
jgi:hypothetical protein